MNSVSSVAIGRPKKQAIHHASPPGNSCRSVRSLSESESESIPVLVGTWPSSTAQTSLPSCVRTGQRYPVSHVRIPSRVLSIPIPIARPIAIPTPTLLRALTFPPSSPFSLFPTGGRGRVSRSSRSGFRRSDRTRPGGDRPPRAGRPVRHRARFPEARSLQTRGSR